MAAAPRCCRVKLLRLYSKSKRWAPRAVGTFNCEAHRLTSCPSQPTTDSSSINWMGLEHPLRVRRWRLAELVDVEGAKHVRLVIAGHLDDVGHAVFPISRNRPWHPALLPRRKHLVPNLKAQLGVDFALEEAVDETLLVQVLPDENKTALALLVLAPIALEIASVNHTDTLEDILGGGAVDIENALVTVEVGPVLAQHQPNPTLHEIHVQWRVEFGTATCHRRVVLVLPIRVQELRVHLQHAVEAERVHVNQMLRIDFAVLGPENLHGGVDLLYPLLDRRQLLLLDQVRLVQQNAVREGHLLHRLVLNSLRLLLVQPRNDVLGVYHCDDAIEAVHALDVVVYEESLRNWRWVGQSCRLDDHRVEQLDLLVQLF
mmetsp:Transcript_38520/g.116456  ORF Transcript_38520/g.116456 Transcript_38520/m.116456 type:complete len:373 (+) Transcript_38520:225-1343(+)